MAPALHSSAAPNEIIGKETSKLQRRVADPAYKIVGCQRFLSSQHTEHEEDVGSIYMVLHDGSLIQNYESSFVSFVWFVVRTRDRRWFSP